MSKANDIKKKLEDEKRRKESAAKNLFGGDNQKDESSNVNINKNNDNNDNVDIGLDDILSTASKAKFDKELVGIYFEPDVKAALDKYQKAEGRGAKSDLLNSLAKYAMKQKGFLR